MSKKVIKKYIGKRGYILKKSEYNEEFIQKLREKLRVTPAVNTEYCGLPESFAIYRENVNKFYVPKFYGLEHLGEPDANILPKGQDINIQLSNTFKINENQKEPIEKTLEALNTKGGGILALSTGYGKTVIMLYLISQIKKKTLVIVHKEFLLNQWKERIEQFLPNARIGIIQANKYDVDNCDIVIGMLQSISGKIYAMDAFDSFGMVAIDECHRIPCQHFSKALLKINAPYMIGLSATPHRDDGLTKVLKWFIGDVIFEASNIDAGSVDIYRYHLNIENDNKYGKIILNQRGTPQIQKMLDGIVNCKSRNNFILQLIKELIQENSERRILLLSGRRLHLETIANLIETNKLCTYGYYIGGMKEQELKESETKQVILGTYSMASEGMDIQSLNTLILASPMSKIIQSVGRIIRKKHISVKPRVIDLIDNFSIFDGQAFTRKRQYNKSKYCLYNSEINIDADVNEINISEPIMEYVSPKKTTKNNSEPKISFNSCPFS